MIVSFDVFTIILFFGAAQGVFLASLLLGRHGNKKANRILAILVVFYSIFIINSILFKNQMLFRHPQIVIALDGLPFLFGPLHFLYAKYLIASNKKFSAKEWLHFIPFIIYKVYNIPAYFVSEQELITYIKGWEITGRPFFLDFSGWVICVQGLTYMVLTIILIKKYNIRLKEVYSTIDKINLNWLRNITYMTFFIWIVVFVENMLIQAGREILGGKLDIISLLTAIFIYIMGYLGLSKSEIFSQLLVPDGNNFLSGREYPVTGNEDTVNKSTRREMINEEIALSDSPKYEKSGLSLEKARTYLNRLLYLMEQEKPFQKSELTLQQLSDKLSISTHNLSQVINTQLKQNFFDFVNQYRVEEVKRALGSPEKQHLKILSIALDAGFNSKTSFNTIFKKFTDQTPSEYRKYSLARKEKPSAKY